ncbi:MAG: DUF362 domain-containing protein [Kiritimatiellaeota bacterium]|nr:DUF362 domain-containing protein [Kiritimatiellota bacterium]
MNLIKTKVSAVECRGYDRDVLRAKVAEVVELAGGWPESILRAKKILLKPNLLSARPPEQAVTTHPELVRAVVRELRDATTAKIALGDSPAGSPTWDKLWTETGMKKISEEENFELIQFENVKKLDSAGGDVIPVLKELDDFDAVVSLPKLKPHILTKLTAAVKNSYGLIPGKAKSMFHGQYQAPVKMAGFLVDCYELLKPDFVIMDGVVCMEGEGPANGSPYDLGIVFASADALAVDSRACRVYGYEYGEIPLLAMTAERGLGAADDASIEETGDAWDIVKAASPKRSHSDFLHKVPQGMFHLLTYILSYRPAVDQRKCVKCGMCAKVCSQDAITVKNGKYVVKTGKCILCMCCMESCASHAISLKSLWKRVIGL